MTRVFVYGTLKRGFCNHHLLTGQQFLGEARTAPGFTLYSLGDYPGLVPSADPLQQVVGEMWAVDPECLRQLDLLEGVAEQLYARRPIPLAPPFAHETVESYFYLRSIAGRASIGAVWLE